MESGKLFKIVPVIEAIIIECIIIEPKCFLATDEQIIPSRTTFIKIRQYNLKKSCKWGFKNKVRAGSSWFMYDFYLYVEKKHTTPTENAHLSNSAQSVVRLCLELPRHAKNPFLWQLVLNAWTGSLPIVCWVVCCRYHQAESVACLPSNFIE